MRYFLVKPIGDAGTVAMAGRTVERWSGLTCRTIFDHPHVSLIEPPQSRVSIDRNHARTPEMSADVTCSKAEIESNEVQSDFIIVDENSPRSQTPKSKRQSRRANDQYGVTLEDSVSVTAVTELT